MDDTSEIRFIIVAKLKPEIADKQEGEYAVLAEPIEGTKLSEPLAFPTKEDAIDYLDESEDIMNDTLEVKVAKLTNDEYMAIRQKHHSHAVSIAKELFETVAVPLTAEG